MENVSIGERLSTLGTCRSLLSCPRRKSVSLTLPAPASSAVQALRPMFPLLCHSTGPSESTLPPLSLLAVSSTTAELPAVVRSKH